MFKGGWTGRILWIDLNRKKYHHTLYDAHMALEYIGGRGFAVKILWDYLEPGTDPLHPDNLLIFAVGPLTGLPIPSSGKLVIASKSPLTGGYGDGNIGSKAAVMMRKAGIDVIVISGKVEKPSYLYIEDDKVNIKNAGELWGLKASEVHDILEKEYGRDAGILTIGPAGERMIRYATVMSEKNRAGGRPGMGAVMGSKNLKAVVIKGTKEIPVYNERELRELGVKAYRDIRSSELYTVWMKQGTMGVYSWCNENSVLPTYNFREGVFEDADKVCGDVMVRYKVEQKGCPNCNMICGMICESKDEEKVRAELDYENVAMLSSNIGVSDMNKVIKLIRYVDDMGFDAISAGSIVAFTIEAYEKKLIKADDLDGLKIEWGDADSAIELMNLILEKKKFAGFLAMGVKYAAMRLGEEAVKFAMHVKGLPITAYDCHIAPAMALAFGTCSIGAHHKEAWVISWEAKYGFDKIDKVKVEKVIEHQRIRGGMFETLVTCRLPWIELGLNLEYYPKMLTAATGVKYDLNRIFEVADRIYALIRAFWIREYGYWSREMDTPPKRWFEEPLTKGPKKGAHLDYNAYNKLLDWYYELRGWDQNGIPRRSTLERIGLYDVVRRLEAIGIKLSD